METKENTTTTPMTEEDARLLDKQIRDAADSAGAGLAALDDLPTLLAEAEAGRIHEVLPGFASFDDYVNAACAPMRKALDRDRRRAVVAYLREAGWKVRQIAAATGISKSTVGRLLSQTGQREHDEDDNTREEPNPQPADDAPKGCGTSRLDQALRLLNYDAHESVPGLRFDYCAGAPAVADRVDELIEWLSVVRDGLRGMKRDEHAKASKARREQLGEAAESKPTS